MSLRKDMVQEYVPDSEETLEKYYQEFSFVPHDEIDKVVAEESKFFLYFLNQFLVRQKELEETKTISENEIIEKLNKLANSVASENLQVRNAVLSEIVDKLAHISLTKNKVWKENKRQIHMKLKDIFNVEDNHKLKDLLDLFK